jgi:putative ABC transport system permease protein
MLTDLLHRCRSFFRRRQVESELDDELNFHIEREVEQQVRQGIPLDEARRRARLRLGGVDQTKEQCRQARGVHMVESTLQDVAHALRALQKNPIFATGAVLTLALGIATTTVVFSVVDSALFNPVPYKDANRLVRIWRLGKTGGGPFQPIAMLDIWRQQQAIFEQVEGHTEKSFTLAADAEPEQISVSYVSVGLLPLLGVHPQFGRLFASNEASEPVALISSDLWTRDFGGSRDVIGQPLHLGDTVVTVVGVMPLSFQFPSRQVDVWLPLNTDVADPAAVRGINPVAKLRAGLPIEKADSLVSSLSRQLDVSLQSQPADVTARVQYLDRWAVYNRGGQSSFARNRRMALIVVFVAAVFVLLVAAANSANLFLSRAVSRTREIAVRAALGGSRWRLARQVLTEALVVALMAGAAGLLLSWGAIRALVAVLPSTLLDDSLTPISLNTRAVLCAFVVSLCSGLIAATVPALRAATGDFNAAFGSTNWNTGREWRFRGVMIMLETALAVILLVGAGLIGRTLWTLLHVNPGWTASGLLIVEPRFTLERYGSLAKMWNFEQQFVAGVRSIPGIQEAAVTEAVPLSNSSISWGTLKSDNVSVTDAFVTVNHVEGPYFKALGIPLLSGRTFDPQEDNGLRSIIVTSQLAERLWPNESPIGKQLSYNFDRTAEPFTVIGVVADVQSMTFEEQRNWKPDGTGGDPLELYETLPHTAPYSRARYVVVKTDGRSGIARDIRAVARQFDPSLPLDVRSMNDVYQNTLANPRFQAILLGVFAGLTLCLAVAGVYAVVAYEANSRTREIGIRIALGAGAAAVMRHVMRRFLLLACGGIAVGVLAGMALTRLMASMLYGVRSNDPLTFAASAAVLIAAAAIAGFLPARRATRINPTVALRWD